MNTKRISFQGRAAPIAVLVLGTLVFAGCAHLPSDVGTADVQAAAQARTSAELSWAPTDETVHALLEKPLTPDSAAQIALLRNPEAAKAFAELGLSRADLIEAGTLANPSIGALARFGLGDASGTMLDLDGGFPLLGAVMLPMRRSIEEQHFERAKLLAADRVVALMAEARTAWFEAVAAHMEQAILADSKEAASAAADLARAQYEAGNLSRLERLGHESLAVRTRLDARALDADTVAREESLRKALGLRPSDPQWLLMPAFPAPSGAPGDSAALEAAALEHRLDFSAATHEVDAMQRALHMTKRFRWLGMVDVGVSAEREFDGEWSLGPSIDFELPIFDRKRGAVLRFESLVALAQAERDALEASIRAEVRTLAARLSAAAESATAYENELLPLHRDLVAETQLHYNGMLIGVYELLNAKQAELEAQRGAVHAQLDYWRTRTELERAIAGSLPETTAAPAAESSTSAPPAPQTEHEHHEHQHEQE